MSNQELKTRVYSSIIFVLIVAISILAGECSTLFLFLLINILCITEFYHICIGFDRKASLLVSFTFLALVPYVFGAFWLSNQLPLINVFEIPEFQIFLWAYILLLFLWVAFIFYLKSERLSGILVLLGSIIYISIPFTLAALISFFPNGHRPYTILGVFIIMWITDSAAYLIGKRYGKNKLAPKISPNKTVEGFLSGVLFALIFAMIVFFAFDTLSFYDWLAIGVIISTAGPAGDIIESRLKRKFGLKDSGHFLPGHGGALDRFDGFIFAIPFTMLYLTYFC